MYFFEHVNNVRSCSFKYRSLYFIKIKNSYADRSFVVVANSRHPSPECDPLTSAVCPPDGRHRRQHLEGGNSRIGSIRRGRCSQVFL